MKEKIQILKIFLKKFLIPKTRSSILRWVATLILSLLLFLSIVTIAFVAVLRDREVQIPKRFAGKILHEINTVSSKYFIEASDFYLSLDDDFLPEIKITNFDLFVPDKKPIISFNSLTTKFSLSDLFFGKFRVSSITLDSANLFIMRKNDGSINLGLGAENTSEADYFDTVGILKQLDEIFTSYEMERFKDLNLFGLTAQIEDQRTDKRYTIDGARLRLDREDQVMIMSFDLALLSGGQSASTVEGNFKRNIGQLDGEFGLLFNDFSAQDIANLSPEFGWLGVLEAPISGAFRGSLNKNGNLNPVNATLKMGSGLLKPTSDIKAIAFNSARTYFSYSPGSGEINFDEIFVDSKDLKATADGILLIDDMEDFPETFVSQLNFTDLQTGGFGLLKNGISSNSANATFRVQLDPFDVEIPQLYIHDQNSAVSVHTDGYVSVKDDNWNVSLNSHSEAADLEKVFYFWPEKHKPKVRKWVADHFENSNLFDISMQTEIENGLEPKLSWSFAFSETSFAPLKGFSLIEKSSGHFVSKDYSTSVVLEEGIIFDDSGKVIDVAGSSFFIKDSRIKPSPAEIQISAFGALSSISQVLNKSPLKILDRVEQPVNFGNAQVSGKGSVKLLLKSNLTSDEISYQISGTAKRFSSDVINPKFNISNGTLDFFVDEKGFKIKGDAKVKNLPVEANFSGSIEKEEEKFLEIDFNLSEQALEIMPFDMPDIQISGSAPAKLYLKFLESKKVELNLTSNLKGIEVNYPPIGWVKDMNDEAELKVSGALGKEFTLLDISLNSPELRLQGSAMQKKDENPVLDFDKLYLKDVFDLQLIIEEDGALQVTSGQLNMQEFLKLPLANSSSKKTIPATIYLDELKLYENQVITRFTAALDANGKGNFSGSLNDLASFDGDLERVEEGYSIKANSNNAGSFVRALGAAKAADGGTAHLKLRHLKNSSGMQGKLKIKNIRLRNMPALLELLDAISIVGLLDQLQGPGLVLNEIEAEFVNLPDQIKFERASAFGPSIGISLEGYYAKGSNNLNMQGVLSPLYVVNAIGSIFTRKGEGLLGFNYRLKGNAGQPEVLVNPLSIFTPAIFREIFRRPVPNLE